MQKLPWILVISGLAVGIISIVIGWVIVPNAVQKKIEEQVQIKNGTKTFVKWSTVPIQIFFKVKLFNVTNPKEIAKGEKPILQEVGPFVYEEKRKKFDIEWNDDETEVKFRQRINYFFRPDLSTGSEDDVVTFLNVPLTVVAKKLSKKMTFVRSAAIEVIEPFEETLFIKRTVGELLFHGYHQPMIAALEELQGENMLKNQTFGFFYPKNGSDEGQFKIFTGVGDSTKFGQVISWENKEKLDLWPDESCNMINGSDGSLFPPFVTRDRVLRVFSGEMCRSAYFTYEKDMEFRGIPTYRFTFPRSMLEDPKINEDNKCFCPYPDENKEDEPYAGCQRGGTHFLSACRKEAPIAMSFPHFYNGDPGLVEEVEGLKPVYDTHATYIDIEPTRGSFMQLRKCVQINVQLRPHKFLGFRKVPNVLFPLLWLEETATNNEEGVTMIKEQLLGKLKKVDTGKWIGVAVGALLVIAGVGIFVLRACNRRYKVTP